MERREEEASEIEEGSDEPKDVEVYEVQTVQRTADRRDLFLRDFCAVVRIIARLRRNQIYVIQMARLRRNQIYVIQMARLRNSCHLPDISEILVSRLIYQIFLPQEFPHINISKSLASTRYKNSLHIQRSCH